MKKCSLLLVLLLSSCQTGPVPVAYKAGSTGPQRLNDYDQCKIASFREIPQSMATEYNPGYYNPGTVQCSTIGNTTSCNNVGAVNIPGSATSYDANGELRQRYIQRCMASKGYQFKLLPPCGSQEERTKAYNQPQPANSSEFKCASGMTVD